MDMPFQFVVNSNIYRLSTEVHFVLCKACFWCASCFNEDERPITKCPYCDSITVESIPISYNEGYKFEYNANRGVTVEFEPRRQMSMIAAELPLKVVAKTCVDQDRDRKVTYSVADNYDSHYIDKKDIISAQLEACNGLLKSAIDTTDKEILEKEIGELRMVLDLIP
jgi:hypothetical protein